MKKINTGDLKILMYDLETSPNLSWVWGKWQQDVIAFEKESHILAFSYKWLGESKVYGFGLPDFPRYKKNKEDDLDLVKKLHEVMCEADIIIAHNGFDFDFKVANTAFVRNGLKPATPSKMVDTKRIAKNNFRFNSNSLNDLGTRLGIGQKTETGGFKLWKGCLEGDTKSWSKMVRYNKNDVVLLEKVYLKLRPWATNHPITHIGNIGCSVCGGKEMEQRGWAYLNSGKTKKKRMVCKSCGHWNLGNAEKN